MGGWGSGPYGAMGAKISKTTTEHCRSIDIRQWQKEKMLDRPFIWSWWNEKGEQTSSIRVHPQDDYMTLKYRTINESLQYRISLNETLTGYGKRKWFLCPCCDRRVAILYLKNGYFKCRTCQDLNYRSSQTSGDRMAAIDRKLEKIHRKLGAVNHDPYGLPPFKPKQMHWDTYQKLVNERNRLYQERKNAFCSEAIKIL